MISEEKDKRIKDIQEREATETENNIVNRGNQMAGKGEELNDDVNEGVYDDDLHPDVIARRQIKKSDDTLKTGLAWFKYGWEQFKKSPILFVIGAVVWVGIEVGLAFLPPVGEIIDGLLFPFMYAGFLFAANDLEEKGKISFLSFFKGFSNTSKIPQLMLMGIPMVIFEVVEFLVLETVGPLIALLMAAPLMVMVLCGLLYAVPLVIFKDYSTLEAIKSSYSICGKNVSPLITVFLMMLVCSLAGVISFGVGFAVIIPVTFIAFYKSQRELYKDIRTEI